MKIKILICLVCLGIVLSVRIIGTNSYSALVQKRWGNLTWNDFQGDPDPFSSFDAAISSTIHIEYDSIKNRYVAFAVQNNMRSWKKDTSSYLLRHEQYHFNITEVHARLLDKYISENSDAKSDWLEKKHNFYLDLLGDMQDQYDKATDHGILYGSQMYWEFKIDSLLTADSGWKRDNMTGAKAYFPSVPKISKGINSDGYAFRTHELHKYRTIFTMESYQVPGMSADIIERILARNESGGDKILVREIVVEDGFEKVKIVLQDSSGWTTHRYWIRKGDFLYQASVKPPKNLTDSLPYNRMAYAFLNSFAIEDVQPYWIERKNNTPMKVVRIKTSSVNSKQGTALPKKPASQCWSFVTPAYYGVYNGPIFTEDGSLLIVLDISKDSLNNRKDHVLFIGDDLYSYERDSSEQMYYVPSERLPSTPYEINFGYTLRADSAQACMNYFNSTIHVGRNK